MSQLMSENELRQKIDWILYGNDHPVPFSKGDALTLLFLSQKRAFAAQIIGTDEPHSKKCHEYGNIQQLDKFCICNSRQRNTLRVEQRELAGINDVKS